MTKTDNWLIERFQWLYDYALDRWGIMVGMIGQIAMVADFGIDCMRGVATAYTTIWIIIMVALLELRNLSQRKGEHVPINEIAMELRGKGFIGYFRRGLIIGSFIGEIVASGLFGIITGFCYAIFYYSYCLMVRDRDEGRFKEHKLAYQRE